MTARKTEQAAVPHQRRTRIVATLGPATDPPEMLEAVLRAGVDVVRLNFSHGDPSAARSASSPTCRARRSASRPSPRARSR